MMNDYCAKESTAVEDPCERQMSASELIRDIRKELSETVTCLLNIEMSLCGEQMEVQKQEEPRCLNDELKLIERMAMDSIGLSHKIHDKLFWTDAR